MTPEAFVIENLFQIVDKARNEVPFRLNSAQRAIDENWHLRNIIPKARQEGVSAFVLARFTVICMSRPNTRAVVISHEKEATERMLDRVHFYLDHLKSPPAVLENESKSEITFRKTGSSFYIGTAGAKAFGRGDTISHLHCSEVAFWPDPEKQVRGLFQAVPKETGEITVESTGNGRGNWYHKQCMRAAEGQSRFRMHFLPWHTFDEYQNRLEPGEAESIMRSLDADLGEVELVENYGIGPERIAWRRDKLEEMSYDMAGFNQEYPTVLNDCFQSSGAGFFHKINYIETPDWERRRDLDGFTWILRGHPDVRKTYAIGADVSGGVGKDYSVAQIIDIESHRQVGLWRGNKTDPAAFAVKLAWLGKIFNNAYLTVESNNHGLLTLSTLADIYPSFLIHRVPRTRGSDDISKLNDLGIRTTVKTKPFMLGHLRKLLAEGFIVHDPVTYDELSAFCENESGRLGAPEGENDDCVMGLSCGVHSLERAAIATEPPKAPLIQVSNPFELASIIDEMRRRRSGFPITPQVI